MAEKAAVMRDVTPNSTQTSILVIGDLRSASLGYLTESEDFFVSGCREEPTEVLSECRRLTPCVLLSRQEFVLSVDQNFLFELVGNSHLNKLLVIGNSGAVLIPELLHLGCSGVLRSDMPPSELHRAIHAVAAGELWFPRKVLSNAIRNLLSMSNPKRLTQREKEILNLIALGYNNREIAKTLFISRETVRWHVRSLYTKLGTHDRKRVIAIATEERRTP
jgi:DNA-binding NarL/FixJ family response regulator